MPIDSKKNPLFSAMKVKLTKRSERSEQQPQRLCGPMLLCITNGATVSVRILHYWLNCDVVDPTFHCFSFQHPSELTESHLFTFKKWLTLAGSFIKFWHWTTQWKFSKYCLFLKRSGNGDEDFKMVPNEKF